MKQAVSRRKKEVFLTGGNLFSENDVRCTLLFGLKQEQERALGTSTEVTRSKVIFIEGRGFNEEDEYFEGRDGVAKVNKSCLESEVFF